jgi:leucyl-tRNA synthetase
MSKSLGNVVNPDDVIKAYGADTMRLYILFIGDFEKTATWSDDAVKGCKRFLDKVWNLGESVTDNETEVSKKNEIAINKAIKKVGEDIDTLKANTAIATLMSLVNNFNANGCNKAELKILLTLLCPFAPHICEEIWEQHGFEGLCSLTQWPTYDPAKTVDAEIDMAIQVNGKFRGTMRIAADVDKDTAIAAALETDIVKRQMAKLGGEVRKTIVVPGKLINLIIK